MKASRQLETLLSKRSFLATLGSIYLDSAFLGNKVGLFVLIGYKELISYRNAATATKACYLMLFYTEINPCNHDCVEVM